MSSSQINLSWTDNASNETGFRIERSSDGTSFTEISTVGSNVTTYADTGLSASTQYWYRVRAYNARDHLPLQARRARRPVGTTVTATICADGIDRDTPTGQFTLAWTDSSNNETGFAIRAVGGRPDLLADRHGGRERRDVRGHQSRILEVRVLPRPRVQRGWQLGVFEYGQGAEPLMRSREDVMRYLYIAMAACRGALHLRRRRAGRTGPGRDLFDHRSRLARRRKNHSDGDQQPRSSRRILEYGRWPHQSFLVHSRLARRPGDAWRRRKLRLSHQRQRHHRGQGAGRVGAISCIRHDAQRRRDHIELTRRPGRRRLRRRARNQQRGRRHRLLHHRGRTTCPPAIASFCIATSA